MARKRRHKTTSKSTPAVIVAVLIFGVIASLFGRRESPPEPVAVSRSSIERVSTAPTAEQQVTSTAPKQAEPSPDLASLPEPFPKAQVDAHPEPKPVTRYVIGRKVALRDGPGKTFGILDRYDSGREITVIETNRDWSHVRDNLTQRDGWIATNLLGDQQPSPPQAKEKQTEEPQKKQEAPPAPPMVSDSLVIQRLIAESIAMYPGTCACPYNTDRRGRSCGRRSAYSKGGGYAPLCYPQDISAGMIANFRKQANR